MRLSFWRTMTSMLLASSILTGSAAAWAETRLFPAIRFRQPPVIDGNNREWTAAPAAPLATAEQTGYTVGWSGPRDLSAELRGAWDLSHLYLWVHVTDDDVAADGDLATDDGIEIALGRAGEKQTSTVLAVSADAAGSPARPLTMLADGGPLVGTEAAVQFTDEGYAVECSIAWEAAGCKPPADGVTRSLPFSAAIHDTDVTGSGPVGRKTTMRWANGQGRLETVETIDARLWPRYFAGLTSIAADNGFYLRRETAPVVVYSGCQASNWRVSVRRPDGSQLRLPAVTASDWQPGFAGRWEWAVGAAADGTYALAGECQVDGITLRTETRVVVADAAAAAARSQFGAADAQLQQLARQRTPDAVAATLRWRAVALRSALDTARRRGARRPPIEELTARVDQFVADTKLAMAGEDPDAGKRGLMVRAYQSIIDDSLQPYSLYVPEGDPPTAGWPLVVRLHGFGGSYRAALPPPELRDALVVHPHGRGNTDYKLWGERDVLDVIATVKRLYPVDENRVLLTGVSMGGSGSWQLGVDYPDLFAAVAPVCGNADYRVWEQEWGWGERTPTPLTPIKTFIRQQMSAAYTAPNLSGTPVYCVHGDADAVVPVGHSRSMVERLRRLRANISYDEQHGVGHGGFHSGTFESIHRWLLDQRRDPSPRHLWLRTSRLRCARSHWLRIDQFLQPLEFAEVEALVESFNRIELRTRNVARLTVDVDAAPVDAASPLALTVDGHPVTANTTPTSATVTIARQPNGAWKIYHPPARPVLEKRAGLEGPIEDAFLDRFLVVYGSSGSEADTVVNRREADKLNVFWRRWANASLRIKRDTEVTDADVDESHLVLIGSRGSNSWVSRVNDYLPVRFVDGGVAAGSHRFRGKDVGIKEIYPNPLNPDRYVVVMGGVTSEGTKGVTTRFGNWFDWGLLDNRHWFDFGVYDATTFSPETFLTAGFFDQQWRLDDDYLWLGDESLRAAPPRPTPVDDARETDEGEIIYLTDLTPEQVDMEKGAPAEDRGFSGGPLRIGTRTYARGLGVHPNCHLSYRLDGQYDVFESWVGIDLEGMDKVSKARAAAEKVVFSVSGDGRLLTQTPPLAWNSPPQLLVVPVTGVDVLKLSTVRKGGRRWLFGHDAWAEARLLRRHDGTLPTADGEHGDLAATMSLNGPYDVLPLPRGEGRALDAHLGNLLQVESTDAPLVVEVPANLRTALADAGRQRLAGNPQRKEWWWSRRFSAPDDWGARAVELEFDRFSYQLDAWVNGRYVGSAESMWTPARFDVHDALRYGSENRLAIRICAGPTPWTSAQGFPLRKPRLLLPDYLRGRELKELPLGILGDVRLRATGVIRLRSVHVRTVRAGVESAQVEVEAHVDNLGEQPLTCALTARVDGASRSQAQVTTSQSVSVPPREQTGTVLTLTVRRPRLWSPRQLGDSHLCRITVEVGYGHAVSDRATLTTGLRTINLAAENGQMTAIVNGDQRLPLRWVEWTPLPSAPWTTAHEYRLALDDCLALGANALFLPASGGFESEAFFDACDRLGLLVAQSLPTQWGPRTAQGDRLRELAYHEQARRLSPHPCLLAWSVSEEATDSTHAVSAGADAALAVLEQEDRSRMLLAHTAPAQLARWWRIDDGTGYGIAAWESATPPSPEMAKLAPVSTGYAYSAYEDEEDEEQTAASPLAPWRDQFVACLRRTQSARLNAEAAPAWQLRDLSESGRGLIDVAGIAKPAWYAVRRAMRDPVAIVHADREVWIPGETMAAEVWAAGFSGNQSQAPITAIIYDGAGRVQLRQQWRSPATHAPVKCGDLRWQVPAYYDGDVFFVRLEWPSDDGGTESSIECFSADGRPPAAVLHALYLVSDRAAATQLVEMGRRVGIGIQAVAWQDADPTQWSANADIDLIIVHLPDAPASAVAHLQAWRRQGGGLILEGLPAESPSAWDNLLPTLTEAVGTIVSDSAPSAPAGAADEDQPVHPALYGVHLASLPSLAGRPAVAPKPDAQVLLQVAGAPVLVERSNRRSRLLAFPMGLTGAELAGAEWEKLFQAAAGYASDLPHMWLLQWLESPITRPFAGLQRLPTAAVEAEVSASDLSVEAGRGVVVRVAVRNKGAAIAYLTGLHLAGAPAGTRVTYSDNFRSLAPGQEWTISMTVTAPQSLTRGAAAQLEVVGWNVPATTVTSIQVGPEATYSYSDYDYDDEDYDYDDTGRGPGLNGDMPMNGDQ